MPSGQEILKANIEAAEAGLELPYPDADSAMKEDAAEEPVKPSEETLEEEVVAPIEEEKDAQEASEDVVDDSKEELAKKDGYMSKEEWIASGKPEAEYMSQEDFIKVGEIRDGEKSRQQMAKQLVQLESTLKDVVTNQRTQIDKAAEDARQEVLANLEAQKKEAIEFQDAEAAARIEREIVKNEQTKPTEVVEDTNPVLTEWYAKNDTWYNIDPTATGALNVQLQKHEKAGLPFEEGIKKAMEVVRANFPYHFDDIETPKKDAPTRIPRGASEKSQKKPNAKKVKTFADIADLEERKIAKQGAKMSQMTETEYMENY